MVWLMRGLVAIALALGLVIVIVVLIGNIGSGDDGTQVTALTVGERTVTVTGHYATLSQESLADGVKVIVEGHEIMVTADQLSVDGRAQVLEPEDNVTVTITKDSELRVTLEPSN
jgi:regulator of protease activity HflC (stomatin/prohibitin superfamily)